MRYKYKTNPLPCPPPKYFILDINNSNLQNPAVTLCRDLLRIIIIKFLSFVGWNWDCSGIMFLPNGVLDATRTMIIYDWDNNIKYFPTIDYWINNLLKKHIMSPALKQAIVDRQEVMELYHHIHVLPLQQRTRWSQLHRSPVTSEVMTSW